MLGKSATSGDIIAVIRELFHRFGIPEQLAHDGGTNLVSTEFDAFLRNWGVGRRLSSAHYPQSNGRAEAAVKSAKRLVGDNPGDKNKIAQLLFTTQKYANQGIRSVSGSAVDGTESA